MGHKGTLRLAQILANRSKTALEEAVLLVTEQLGFQYFMFCGRFGQPHAATDEVRFDNFPVRWHRYCADRGKDLLPGPLRRLALQEVTPLPWKKIATRHGKPLARASEFGLAAGVSCAVHYAAGRIARRGVDRVGPLRQLDGARNRLLSDRESQCLIQSARGKTTSEIGQA